MCPVDRAPSGKKDMHSFENDRDVDGRNASKCECAIAERRHKCDAAQLCGGSKTSARSYVVVAMFGLGALMINAAFWVLNSLTTSFNEHLGSFSLAALYIAYIVSLLLAPSLVGILGSKTCSVLSGLCTLVFTASYFYPSWYTIMPSSVVQGFGYSLMYTTISVTKNDEVRRVVEKLNVDEVTYQGRFTAMIIFTCNSAAIVAGIIAVATLSAGNDHHTSNSSTYLFDNNMLNTPVSCVPLSNSTAAAAAASNNYYILVAVCTAVAFLSVVTFSITRGSAYHQCRVHSFGLREALRRIAKHSADLFKQAITPAYAPVLPLRVLQGSVSAYFFGRFTKMYITECVGVEFVGISVIVWGLFSGFGSFSGGFLMRYTASYVIVVFTIGMGQMGAIVFLIVWERQPSFAAIIIVSAICGLCYGVSSASTLAYAGIAPERTQDTGFSVFVAASSIGQSVQFVLSETVLHEVNLYVILTLSALAVPLFSTADLHFGSGRSRHYCRRKKAVETSDQFGHDSNPKGFLEHSRSSFATKETAV